MASKIEKSVCDNLNKKRNKDKVIEVCAKNISVLSNNDVKIVLSKYSTLSSEEKAYVRQFSTSLQLHHCNRYRNLSPFFKKAYDSDIRVKDSDSTTASVNITEKSDSKDVKVLATTTTTTTNIKSEQKIVTNIPSTNNNSVEPKLNQESTTPPFHTNIISRVNTNNNNNNEHIVNINPFYSTIFPMIHQKVLTQCISSMLLPQVVLNNTINNITAVLNLAQNTNPTLAPVNNQKNTSVESQNKSDKNPPSKLRSENSDKKYASQTNDKTIEKSKQPHSVFDEKNSKNHKEINFNNKSTDNNSKKEPTSKNTPKNSTVQKSNNTVKIKPKSSSNNTKRKEPVVVVQDLESFSMEHMKKIESYAQRNKIKNSIKFNLSSNSQKKISETNSKIKQHIDSQKINLNDIKPFFDDTETNLKNTEQNKIAKETNIIKTSYDEADKRLIEYSTDNLKDDQKIVKSKVIKNSPDVYTSKEKCGLYTKDYRKKAASKSAFLDECNFLKSIISKNSSDAESSKKQKLEIILTKKSKKRKKNKSKKKRSETLKHIKLDEPIVMVQEKIQINPPEAKTIPVEKFPVEKSVAKENNEQVEINKKKPQKREVKVVNRVLRSDNSNDQIIKSISEKPFTEECNKVTNNDTVLVTKQDVKSKLDKTMDTEDLMVLLKYFYKLDGLEQHRLIEFLKELELTEPERVADLRKHVRTSPPDDEDITVVQTPQLEPDKKDPIELEDRPESRNSDLSNIDLILEDIDSILNDEEDEESSNNKEESTEPPSKRLKSDSTAKELVKINDAKCDTIVSSGKTIPVQFRNSQNYMFNYNQNLNFNSNNSENNCQNYTFNFDQDLNLNVNSNQSKNNCQNYTFNFNSNNTPVIQYNNMIQQNINYIAPSQNYGYDNQYYQNHQNYFQDFQNMYYDFNNPVEQYQQNYSSDQNEAYFNFH